MTWLESEVEGIATLAAIIFSLLTASVLISELVSGGEFELLQQIRRRARPMQYLALLWVWVLWFMMNSGKIELEGMLLPLEACQTAMTLFVIVEFSHRIKLGSLPWPSGGNPLDFLKSGIDSLTMLVTTTEIQALRTTSQELLYSIRVVVDLCMVVTLSALLFDFIDVPLLVTDEWLTRLLTLFTLLLVSQVWAQYLCDRDANSE